MTARSISTPVRIAIVGAGAVSDYHHVPGIRLDPRCQLVAACDADQALLERRKADWGVEHITTDAASLCADPNIDALIIATPNSFHAPVAFDAAKNGKHVMCEKPLGLSAEQAAEMYQTAEAAGVVHMTAFTYRFAPSMRYMHHLIHSGALGQPRHFRSQRFLDWPETSWGWRQYKSTAGAGDLYDMTIHRLDLARFLMGDVRRICGAVARFAPREVTKDGQPCAPSEVDDWSALIGQFKTGATGVWEGTTLAKGYHFNGFGHELCEVNGAEGTVVYRLHEPNTIWLGKTGIDLHAEAVPAEFLTPAGSPRRANEGVPATVFRYDLVWEFVSAIAEGRPARPSFRDGWQAQVMADACLASGDSGHWVDVP